MSHIITLKRFTNNPIVYPGLNESIGQNINGPSLIKVPDWLPDPLGQYYLYFAHHQGKFIRLAYADALEGPWQIYQPGTLALGQTICRGHIASPDIHFDHEKQELIMYFHGPVVDPETGERIGQRNFVAQSRDGLNFEASPEILGYSYFRVFHYGGYTYAFGRPRNTHIYRSEDGLTNFEEGPVTVQGMRHTAVLLRGDTLYLFGSRYGDAPEHIVLSQIDLSKPWTEWQPSDPVSILEPEFDYEGGDLPVKPSVGGWAEFPVRELRDPGIYEEDGHTYLLYSVAGEQGIAMAEIIGL